MSIAKRLFFLHLGPDPMPEFARRNINGWRQLLPGWQIDVITDADRPQTPYEDFYAMGLSWGINSDVIRVEELFQRGGVYLDWDVAPIRGFGDLFADCDFSASVSFSTHGRTQTVEPAFLAAAPGHPIFADWRERFSRLTREMSPDDLRGSLALALQADLWDKAVDAFCGDWRGHQEIGFTRILHWQGCKFLPYTSFYLTNQGLTVDQIRLKAQQWPYIWGAHVWANTWLDKSAYFRIGSDLWQPASASETPVDLAD